MGFPLIQDSMSGPEYDQRGADQLPASTGQSLIDTWKSTVQNGPTGALIDAYKIGDLDRQLGQKTLTVPELKQKYPDVNWTEPKKEKVAGYIAREHQIRSIYANRINNSDGGILGSIGRGAIGMFGDPLMDVGAAITGGATGALLGAGGVLAGEGLGAAIGRGAAEGAVVMGGAEAVRGAQNTMLEEPFDVSDSAKQVAFGAALGAGIGALGHGWRQSKWGKAAADAPKPGEPPSPPPAEPYGPAPLGTGAKPEHNLQLLDVATRQLEEGIKPDVQPLVDLHERQRQGVVESLPEDFSGRANYKYQPMNTAEPVTKEFFHGNESGNEDFHSLDFKNNINSHDSFGSGVYVNDNALKANGYAEGGKIHSVSTDGAKLFPVDEAVTNDSMAKVLESPELNMKNFATELMEGKITPREVYANMTEAGKDFMNAKLKEAGFDGLHFEDSAADGSSKSNGVMMFDDKSLKANAAYNYDSKLVGGLTPEEKIALTNSDNNPSRDVNYDPVHQDKVAAVIKEAEKFKPGDQAISDTNYKVAETKLKTMKENGMMTEAHQKEWDAINEAMGERAKQGESILKSMFDCLVAH